MWRVINTPLLTILSFSSNLLFLPCIPCLSGGNVVYLDAFCFFLCSTYSCYDKIICLCVIICLMSPLLDYKLHDDRYDACLWYSQLVFELINHRKHPRLCPFYHNLQPGSSCFIYYLPTSKVSHWSIHLHSYSALVQLLNTLSLVS